MTTQPLPSQFPHPLCGPTSSRNPTPLCLPTSVVALPLPPLFVRVAEQPHCPPRAFTLLSVHVHLQFYPPRNFKHLEIGTGMCRDLLPISPPFKYITNLIPDPLSSSRKQENPLFFLLIIFMRKVFSKFIEPHVLVSSQKISRRLTFYTNSFNFDIFYLCDYEFLWFAP